MKLRLLDDSVRIRVRRSEVRELLQRGVVSCSTCFAIGQELTYELRLDHVANQVTATCQAQVLSIVLPRRLAIEWANSCEVGLSGENQTHKGTLRVLVEKDFPCAHHADDAPGETFSPQSLAL